MISRCYLEVTNICNLDCAFCPKTDRAKRMLALDEFDKLTEKLRGNVKFLYFHLMGEPFLHAQLPAYITMAREKGFVPVLTTNGTLLAKSHAVAEARPYKIQISLHSQEGNGISNIEEYISNVMEFSLKAASNGVIVVLRLWNEGGMDSANDRILSKIAEFVPQPWLEQREGWKITQNIFIEHGKKFEWPDTNLEEIGEENVFCYALRNQIGVLVDGSVVPCCLDHAGDIVLGNLFEQSLDEILSSPRARAIYDGFTRHKAVEALCKRCGYAAITKRYRE